MTSKEMKNLRRSDLLKMLLEMSRENEKLREQNALLRSKLQERQVTIENCGSLAEAALQLSGIFQAAEEACALYTENIRARSADLEARCQKREQETEEACRRMVAIARENARKQMEEARKQLESQKTDYSWLAELMNSGESK